jgi:hypothetical protein
VGRGGERGGVGQVTITAQAWKGRVPNGQSEDSYQAEGVRSPAADQAVKDIVARWSDPGADLRPVPLPTKIAGTRCSVPHVDSSREH